MPFTPEETDSLRWLAAQIIPAAEQLPGADDATIFAEILCDAAPLQPKMGALLRDVASGMGADDLRSTHAEAAGLVQESVVFCYYRDPRVMRWLGMEARAPFPKGFEMDANDFSLLKPVQQRAPFYRKTP